MKKLIAALALVVAAGALPAGAETDYPTKPVTIIVPWGAGNSTDIVTRRLAAKLSERLNQPVVVDNRPGGGGLVGTTLVAQAEADGYTLLMGSSGPNAAAVSLMPQSLQYDPVEDFQPIARIVDMPNVLIVAADHPAETFEELVESAKAAPGSLSYASSGVGTSVQLSGKYLSVLTDSDLLEVGYTSSPPAVVDVVAGRVDMIFTNIQVAFPQVRDNMARALAISGGMRSPLMPDVQTMAELGFPTFVDGSWMGLFAPAGTDQAIIEKLSREVAAITAEPEFIASSEQEGSFPVADETPEKFGEFIQRDIERWREIVTAAGVTLD